MDSSNIMGGGQALTRGPRFEKSNLEFTNALRSNFEACRQPVEEEALQTNGVAPNSLPKWIQQDGKIIYIPSPAFASDGLAEERSQYDITAKLFFLPSTALECRGVHARDAIDCVLRDLRMPSLDLLIVSFPGVTFDADDEDEGNTEDADGAEEARHSDEMIRAWRVLEELHDQGKVRQLGLAEFSKARLREFLPQTRIRPSVDQINVRDCCVVPKSLILYSKAEEIELLTHNDCTNILPKGTTRELLGPGEKGANVLTEENRYGLDGDIEPQWVVKYTAVVRDRGVIEYKGYTAMATIKDSSSDTPC